MTMSDETLARRARVAYHAAARQLDPALAGRLRAARRAALAQAAHPRRHPVRWLVPSGACAAIALATLFAWPSLPRQGSVPAATATTTTETDNLLPPDPEQADPGMYQDLDFYGWLAANGNQAAH